MSNFLDAVAGIENETVITLAYTEFFRLPASAKA